MNKIQQGFTLIELMIVVAIIGILAAIAIPQYQSYAARAQVSEAMSLASSLKIGVAEITLQDGFPTNANSGAYGLPTASTVTGQYVATVGIAAGVITATMRNAQPTSSLVQNGTITLTPTMNAGSVSWVCGGTIATNYRPKSC